LQRQKKGSYLKQKKFKEEQYVQLAQHIRAHIDVAAIYENLNASMKSVHSISILGCGWLGLPLAEQLIKQNFLVKGSVTRPERLGLLHQKKIIPFEIRLTDTSIIGVQQEEFFNSDLLIVNFPPGRKPNVINYHTAQIQQLIKAVNKSSISQVLFISSSAVYPDLNKEVVETESVRPLKSSGKALLEVERLLRSQQKFTTSILRFAGLIGPDRHPGKFLAGKKNVPNGAAPVNIIHRDDCIALIAELIQQQAWGEIFNACADIHPSRKEFYTIAAEQLGLEIPSFSSDAVEFKIINSDKIKKRLGYSFKYPDPLNSLNYLIAG
jgi:nucleoside-diphosphate-sugar epimerase